MVPAKFRLCDFWLERRHLRFDGPVSPIIFFLNFIAEISSRTQKTSYFFPIGFRDPASCYMIVVMVIIVLTGVIMPALTDKIDGRSLFKVPDSQDWESSSLLLSE